MNKFEKIICFIGGANLKILQKCPTDKYKFIATGIGVLNTAVLSMVTIGFAMYSVAKGLDTWLIILFSIFWGFIIFGIDWGLISTIHKKAKYDLKSGSVLLLATLFRLLVAVTISFTVSKPLEVLVFKDYLPVAKREMQVDYQEKLNASYEDKEKTAGDNVKSVEDKLIGLNNEKQQAYQNDPVVSQLAKEKDELTTRYNNLNTKYAELNRQSSVKVVSAQVEINSIQRSIEQTMSDTEISRLKNLQSPYIATRNFENGQIKSRNDELAGINRQIGNKEKAIKDRYAEIDEDFKQKRQALDNQNERLTAEKESISQIVKGEYSKTAETSMVFEKDNLINNIIAIGYLEKWNNDPNAEVGEKEIAKKVIFVSWLLMILIMIVDTAPIVIKLLVKRGCYEEEKEQIEKDNKIKCEADTIAYKQTYPEYAIMHKQYETKINELKDLTNTTIDFYKTINTLVEKSMEEIKKIANAMQKTDNQNLKNHLSAFQDKLANLLSVTTTKTVELYNNFINTL